MGGGTGTVTVLTGLKKFPVELSAVPSIADNGGSSGELANDYGILPCGDTMKCLSALSESEDTALRDLLAHRITGEPGKITGHTISNVMFLAAQQITGSALRAVDFLHDLLRVKGRVIPASPQRAELCARLENGKILRGEDKIDMRPEDRAPDERAPISEVFFSQIPEANLEAIQAIRAADAIVLGPGDLYTSLLPVLMVDGIADAVVESKATLIYVLNLATKHGETDGYPASRFVEVIEEYIGEKAVDYIIANTAPASEAVLERYRNAEEPPVVFDLGNSERVIRKQLLSDKVVRPVPGDRVKRSLLRHDPERLAKAILSVLTH